MKQESPTSKSGGGSNVDCNELKLVEPLHLTLRLEGGDS